MPLLSEKTSSILDRWFDLVLETYPVDSRRFLKRQKDRFANPVGTTLSRELEGLYQEILKGVKAEEVSPILDRIVRIRAIQNFTPSQAVSFVFLLKKAVRAELEMEIRQEGLALELLEFESRVDEAALIAFEIYMKCRERVFEIRANETKNQVSRLLQKAGLMGELPGRSPAPLET